MSETPSEHPPPIFNWMSVIGGGICAVGVTAMLFFFVVGLLAHGGGGYAGLVLLVPFLFALVGLVLFVVGWVREVRRHRRGEHSSFFVQYVVDPWQIVRTRGSVFLLSVVVLATLGLLSAGAGSLAVVEYSESNAFCGEACHSVMGPEYSAYSGSPHSQIACVECHIAPGAEGFLAAKIGGLRQLWSVTFGDVTRPIPTPIRGDSVSRELCERCHSLNRTAGYKTLTREYYLNGLEDAPVQLAMVVKVGGGSSGLMAGSGIHYHMLLARKVEYIARDAQRQDVAWVRVTEGDGSVREFTNQSRPLSEEERASLRIREMDCIDCHSRPAHVFRSPVHSVNRAFARGRLPQDVPNLKEASVRALAGGYATTDEALAGIGAALEAYYDEEQPDVLEDQSEELERAADALREIYQHTIFPEMKANWRAHPNNAGHRESPGCFRCHNDEMVDGEGEPLFADCIRCHAVLAQDARAIPTMTNFESGRDFVHPEDSSVFEEFSNCSECHTGGAELYD